MAKKKPATRRSAKKKTSRAAVSRANRTAKKKQAFLEKLREERSVSSACKAAGCGRSTAYEWRDADEEFRDAWDEVHESNIDDLEASALRRAIEGHEEPLVYRGQIVVDPRTDEPITIRRYSAPLTIYMLKTNRSSKYHIEKLEPTTGGAGEAEAFVRRLVDVASRMAQTVPRGPAPDPGHVGDGDEGDADVDD